MLEVQIIASRMLSAFSRANYDSCPSLNNLGFNNQKPTQPLQHHINLINQFYISDCPGCIETFFSHLILLAYPIIPVTLSTKYTLLPELDMWMLSAWHERLKESIKMISGF